jgi:DUF1365 family protein
VSGEALYVGEVVHTRFAPRRHHLRYGVFQMLFDVDGLDALAARLTWFSHNRFNLFSLDDGDHGTGRRAPRQSLRAFAESQLKAAGLGFTPGRIRLLAMPKVLGFVFNPLSLFFCEDASGRLAAVIYEVHNTFGQRHAYVVPTARPKAGEASGVLRQACDKAFHVSPFMGMDMAYRFAVRPPGDPDRDGRLDPAPLSVIVEGYARTGAEGALGEKLIFAAFTGTRSELSDAALLRQFLALPFLTLKVVAAIHLEALKMWFKGLRLVPAPPAPAESVSVGHPLPSDAVSSVP